MTVTELIAQLDVLKQQGFGDKEVVIPDPEWPKSWPIATSTYNAEDDQVILNTYED